MTPGIKGNSSNNSIMGGGCGGDNQPPCPPRFQAEKIMVPVADRSSRSKSIKSKKKADQPLAPPKLKINLPKGFKMSKLAEQQYQVLFGNLSGYKNQEALDKAVMKFAKLYGSPIAGPIEGPILEAPGPIKAPVAEIEVPAEGGPEGVKAKIAK